MVFSSLIFLVVFFPLVLLFYFSINKSSTKNIILLIFSLIFYAWGEPVYIVLMIFSSIVDYTNGRMIEKYRDRSILPKVFLVFSVIVNLSLLGFFKYSNFLVGNINSIFNTSIAYRELRLPIGISFYTFQTMSYSIDVYRNKVKAEHNFPNFMAYVSMFPQLIAGPIVRYSLIQKELTDRTITKRNVLDGSIRFIQGLAKKVLLANNIGLLATSIISSHGEVSAMTAWLGAVAFAFQIFFDFSGYSDMAIGMGKIFGFTYPENFYYPYTCTSITDFWNRWHMSLSTWFKDYLYIPLGGNRKGNLRTILNLIIVWSLTGLWHGAAWNFMLWGLYFGIILIIEKFVISSLLEKMPVILKRIYSLVIVLIGWVIFMLDTPKDIVNYIISMFSFGRMADIEVLFNISNYGVILILCVVFSMPLNLSQISEKLRIPKLLKESAYLIFYIGIFLLSIVYIVDNTFNPFLYFRF
ncbi:MAG: MBOAT family protein [Clostridia bacterium]|nr:MBOAT family protein [Clostridia bacterium]